MIFRLIASILIVFSIATFARANQNEEFHEELYVKPLLSGQINTYFQFTTRWKLSAGENLHHTRLMHRTIAEILEQFDVKELHISLTQGLWRYESWGYPVVDAAPGAEMWAWFSGNLTRNEVDSQWKRLASTLSGVLCASLNFIDMTNTVEPKYGFRPQFGASKMSAGRRSGHVRYSTLPREIVCTENLTPWKKLLPCSSRIGFASLLNSGNVHNTFYHSLALKLRTLCDDQITENCVIELQETANLVYDQKLLGGSDFSLRKMFGQGLNGDCPLADTSLIYVDVTNGKYTLTPEPREVVMSQRGGIEAKFAIYNIKDASQDRLFNIAWVAKDRNSRVSITPAPPIYAHRYILNHGQERGKVVSQVTNTHWGPLNIILQENIPWYVPVYLHTLSVKVNGERITPKLVHYIPGEQRERPYHLELALSIPPKSTMEISLDFDFIFLKWLEYPPDANHGHYLGSAVISTVLPNAKNYTSIPVDGYLFAHSINASRPDYFLQIRTESLILTLPTPDFSMPYNVICLACTVVALAFGPIHNAATKKIIIERRDISRSIIAKLKRKLFGKKTSKKEEASEEKDVAEGIEEVAEGIEDAGEAIANENEAAEVED